MKVTSFNEDTLIIQCENFEAGKKPFLLPKYTLIWSLYLFFILTITCFSVFNSLEFLAKIGASIMSYAEIHPVGGIVCSLTFLIFFFTEIDNLFFKKSFIRIDRNYRIDKNGCFSSHPPYSLSQKIEKISYEEIFNAVRIINKIDIVEDFRIGVTYDEDSGSAAAYAIASYKVIIEFNTEKYSIIESGSINTLSVGNDNQVAFNKLIAETKIAVNQVESFLAASKN